MTDEMSNSPIHYHPVLHWIILLGMIPVALIALVVAAAPAMPILYVLFIPCLPALANSLITFFFTDIELNEQRLVYASGLFRRRTFDLPVARIESVQMEQSLLGRLMGYGQVTVIAIGSSPITTPSIKQPEKFCEALQVAIG